MTGSTDRLGVLYVLGTLEFGGTERHVLELSRRLDRRRFAPSLGVVRRRGELTELFEQTGLPICSLGDSVRPLSPRGLVGFRRMARFAREHDVRIVHGFNFHGSLYGALLCGLDRKLRLVTSQRSTGEKEFRRWDHRLGRRFYERHSRRMLVNSPEVRAFVERAHGPRGGGWIRELFNGVDTEWIHPDRVAPHPREPLSIPSGVRVVGHVGRFREEKGQVFMLEAFAELACERDDVHFVLIGGGSDQDRLEAMAREHPLVGRTTVLGFQEDVRPFLRMMDVFVLPSRAEGMPNALMEAMAMAVACVATRVGGTGVLLDEGKAGRLIDFGDRAGLTATLRDLLERDDERERLGRVARARIRERFSMDAMLRAYEAVYREVAAGRVAS